MRAVNCSLLRVQKRRLSQGLALHRLRLLLRLPLRLLLRLLL
jgi:hypothetical protein